MAKGIWKILVSDGTVIVLLLAIIGFTVYKAWDDIGSGWNNLFCSPELEECSTVYEMTGMRTSETLEKSEELRSPVAENEPSQLLGQFLRMSASEESRHRSR